MDRLQELDRVGDVGRGEILAVVPFHVGTQLEGIGLAVRADRPLGRELRSRLDVVVVLEQALGDLGADRIRRRCHRGQRHQGLRLDIMHEDQSAAMARGGAGATTRGERARKAPAAWRGAWREISASCICPYATRMGQRVSTPWRAFNLDKAIYEPWCFRQPSIIAWCQQLVTSSESLRQYPPRMVSLFV